jgi:dTDP-4-dehydrorhamnose reductase
MLVTGGSGYLGGWVVRLAREQWELSATYLRHLPDQAGATWQKLDLRDPAAVAALVAETQPAVVVHTAAAHSGTQDLLESTNVIGTRNVARAAAAADARLIHISTDAIFDGGKGNYIETDPPKPITPYGRSKALAEEEVILSKAQAVIVRTSLIYGWQPHISRNVRWMIQELGAGKQIRLFTDELRCPIWVESLAAAVVELAGLRCTGTLHVAGAQTLSRQQFGLRMLRFLGIHTGSVVAVSSRELGLNRPLDCSLDCSQARAILKTALPGVDEVLERTGLCT